MFLSSPWICESKISLEKNDVLDDKNSLLPSFHLKYNLYINIHMWKPVTTRYLALRTTKKKKGGGAFTEYATQAEHMNPSLSFPSKFEFLNFSLLVGMLFVVLSCCIFLSMWVLEGLTQLCLAFLFWWLSEAWCHKRQLEGVADAVEEEA